MRRIRGIFVVLLLLGYGLASVCALAQQASAQSLLIRRGCHSGQDLSNSTVNYGFRSWYAAKHDGTGKYGLVDMYGVFTFSSVTSFSENTGSVLVQRYKRYGAGDAAYLVVTDYFGPGGGYADYIAFDSIRIVKTAADTIAYKFCW